MTIEKKPFVRYSLETRPDGYAVIAIRLNEAEQKTLLANMRLLQQPKASTAIKQLMKTANEVLHSAPEGKLALMILDNLRKNERIGIVDVEQEISPKLANVNQVEGDSDD